MDLLDKRKTTSIKFPKLLPSKSMLITFRRKNQNWVRKMLCFWLKRSSSREAKKGCLLSQDTKSTIKTSWPWIQNKLWSMIRRLSLIPRQNRLQPKVMRKMKKNKKTKTKFFNSSIRTRRKTIKYKNRKNLPLKVKTKAPNRQSHNRNRMNLTRKRNSLPNYIGKLAIRWA